MKKTFTLYLLVILTVFLAYSAMADVFEKVSQDFSLMGTDGNEHSLADYKDAKAIVIMFVATQCPISNGFNERMVDLANTYMSKGVVFLGINSNKQEKFAEVKEHAQKHGFPFVVLKDENNVVADQFQAKVTPEVYVLNGNHDILYHGRIDDAARADERKSEDLKKALDEILAGEPVSVSTTKAFGCTIKRISP
ncbi:thioredoxin family protein [candidate division KSB1 bacterium]|nr:thioredoxin family protein [candidate division KSB1 bacterium]